MKKNTKKIIQISTALLITVAGVSAVQWYVLPQKDELNLEMYQATRWQELIPTDDLKEIIDGNKKVAVGEGDITDKISSGLSMNIDNPQTSYEKALTSTRVNNAYHNKKVKISGFAVPVDILGAGITKEFFFVPYFGACLHLPPPPPNQIIYVHFEEGFEIKSLQIPYTMYGTLQTQTTKNGQVTTAYTADAVAMVDFYKTAIKESQ